MAPATSAAVVAAQRIIGFSCCTQAPRRPLLVVASKPKKYKSMTEIMAKARYAVIEREDYGDATCEQCGTGERPDELLPCDKCDKGFHMNYMRPIVVRVPIGSWLCPKCSGERRMLRSVEYVQHHWCNCGPKGGSHRRSVVMLWARNLKDMFSKSLEVAINKGFQRSRAC